MQINSKFLSDTRSILLKKKLKIGDLSIDFPPKLNIFLLNCLFRAKSFSFVISSSSSFFSFTLAKNFFVFVFPSYEILLFINERVELKIELVANEPGEFKIEAESEVS